ncbi:MAG: YfhO family protein [Ruminococcus sp.]|nr:YfhO family protein [Ruminococcus sp.]
MAEKLKELRENIYKNLHPAMFDKERYLLLFVLSMLGIFICCFPSLLVNDGIFLYYGDFNSQQEMFYYHSNEMIRNGNFGWDWGTDLGSSFIGSYSFYLLGSPFFWVTTIFPPSWEVYLIPVMLGVKTGCAAMFAYAYIRLFVKNKDAAFIGAMLYAFSGFQAYNVFFNHFHDATAFFPLLLLGLELNIKENKRGAFALAVAICACISYFFFFGEVIFVIIYFVIRLLSGEYKIGLKKLFNLAFEAVMGVMLAAVIFLPACLDTINNPRLDEHLWGDNLIVYNDKYRILRIIQSFFMLPDMPARPNIFNADSAKWASIAGYMPLFSMTGVIAFLRTKQKSWAKRLVITSFIMMVIPGLNAIYAMMTASYYARWYFMPILIMAMMTAKMLEEDPEEIKKAFPPVAGITVFFILCGLVPKKVDDKIQWLKMPKYLVLYVIQAGAAVVLLIALAITLYKLSKSENFMRYASLMTVGACMISMALCVWYGVTQGPYNDYYIEHAIRGREKIDLTEFETAEETNAANSFYRIDTSPNVDNWCMIWGLSSMRCFQSVVPSSIMEFYEISGQERNVASRIETKYYAFRGLFSVKYYFDEVVDNYSDDKTPKEPKEQLDDMTSFKYVGTQNGFNIYKNELFIPMGFTYDEYITKEEYEKLPTAKKVNTLMEALVLDESDIEKNADILEEFTKVSKTVTRLSFEQESKEKIESACYSFDYDTNGFEAKNRLDKESLVFFSVPYTEGWSAEVNGEKAEIIKASYGFMAVRCKAGENDIVFHYVTPGLKAGAVMTGISALTLVGYVLYYRRLKKREEKN